MPSEVNSPCQGTATDRTHASLPCSGAGRTLARSYVFFFVLMAVLLVSSSIASATVLPEEITENMTLTAEGSPYTGSSVTIQSGVTVKAEPGAVVTVSSLTVSGTLKAEGTAEENVVFTSGADSEPDQWGGIVFSSGSSGVIDHAEVRYGGAFTSTAAIKIEDASPTITHSTIRDNAESGIQIEGSSSSHIAYNSVLDNTGTGIFHNAGSGDTGAINVHDNVVEGNTNRGIFISVLNSSIEGTSLGANTIKGNGSTALYCQCAELPPDLDDNTLSGNRLNYVDLSGTLKQSATRAKVESLRSDVLEEDLGESGSDPLTLRWHRRRMT